MAPPGQPASPPSTSGPTAPTTTPSPAPSPIQPVAPSISGRSTPLQRPDVMEAPAPRRPEPVMGPPPLPPPGPQPPPPSDSAADPMLGPLPPAGPSIAPEAGPRSAQDDDDPALDGTPSPDAALAEASTAKSSERYPHRGIVGDLRVGTLGCIGPMCRDERHAVSPGVRVGGFFGGNIRGWVELGIAGGWGTMKPGITPGTNALLLYGLDPAVLQQALFAQAAGLLNVDLAGLAVSEAQMRSVQAGPRLRIHLRPRGRVGAFVGTGAGYHLLRNRYETGLGPLGLDFHGVEVPVEANLSVYVRPHLAVGVQFDYMWTWYGLAVLDHPQQRVALPMRVLQAAGEQQGVDLRGELPQLWTVGLALRGRL